MDLSSQVDHKVVGRFVNGRTLKGVTPDFFPNRAVFHIDPADGSARVQVHWRDLKALFFVKSLEGNHLRKDVRGFINGPGETSQGKKLAVRFKDGEMICGYSLSYSADRDGFFMFPADAGSNNLRVFVVTAAAATVRAGPAAEALAKQATGAGVI